MHITNFKYFLAVAETGSVRQASDRMNVSASALSRQIQNLEHEIGATLFERRVNGMVLTQEGRILKRHMQRTMRELELAQSHINNLHGLRNGRVSYVTIDGVASPMLLPAIAKFQTRYPQIQFSGTIAGSEQVLSAVLGDDVDFGVALRIIEHPDIEVVKEFPTRFQAAMSSTHRLAQKESISLEELSREPLTLLNDAFESTRILKHELQDRGLSLSLAHELDNVELVKRAVLLSDTLTVLPDFALRDDLRLTDLNVVEISGTYPTSSAIVFSRKGRHQTHATNRFFDFLISEQVGG